MSKARIIIADGNENGRRRLKAMLTGYGYLVQAEASNAPDLLRKARMMFPDLVILDSRLEGASTQEIVGILEGDELSNVLVLVDSSHPRQLDEIAHINKPYSEETLMSVIEVCLLYQNRFNSIKQEVGKLKKSLTTRKEVEKAKGILMKKMSVDEAEAYRMMQKESMNRSISMIDLSRAIIIADDTEINNKER
ncbi:MAG: response regulator [Firmicutes bacterium HGW-Firmicutes-15]|nr:MAG: response regulator [Firmicutes bacterium HGW-Firmicutes-15]